MSALHTPPPPPMPDVRQSLIYLEDARKAMDRYIWNKKQLEDALRSAEFWLREARIAANLEPH